MFNAPKTTGEVRSILAQNMVDLMYKHMKREDCLAVVEMAEQINQSLRTEIAAYALQVKGGYCGDQKMGSMPIDTTRITLSIKE